MMLLTKMRFTPLSKVYFRLFNELPHETTIRLNQAARYAGELVGMQNNSTLYYALQILKIAVVCVCVVLFPLSFLTRFTLLGVPSSTLVMALVPVLSLLFVCRLRVFASRRPPAGRRLTVGRHNKTRRCAQPRGDRGDPEGRP